VYRTLVITILLASFGLRLAAGCWWQNRLPDDTKFGFPDSESYWMLAETIAKGQPYQTNPDRRVFRTPGYPLLLAGLFFVAGDEPPVMWARVLNALLGTLAVGAVILLAHLLFNDKAALVAGAAAALYPGAISTSTFVLSEAPFCPFMLLHLTLWTLAWKAPDPRRQAILGAAGGVLAGIATLMRPSWLLFLPFAIVVGLGVAPWIAKRQFRRHVWVGAWMVAGLAAAMMPWWIRNWQVTGRFVPTTLQFGESLYDGLNPQATGASDMRFVDRFRQELRKEDAHRVTSATAQASFEERLDRRMRDEALTWAKANPVRVVQLAIVKCARIWNVLPNEASLRQPLFCVVAAAGYLPILIFGICGVWKYARRSWPYLLCFLPATYFTCLHMVFVGSIRYRQPAMLPLIVLAAGFVGHLIWKWAEPT
jgi:4-amino-4-deoxy-L-arabinose transferase-like glycosyltransferase